MRMSPNVIPSPRVAGETERGDPAAAILDIAALCGGAGIPYRVTGGCHRMCTSDGLVAMPGRGTHRVIRHYCGAMQTGLPARDPEHSLRSLEILAHGFLDCGARMSVCGRGLFGPKTP